MPKKITVRCLGPIAASTKYSSPWEDVWLSWTGKPGRKKFYLAPILVSHYDTRIELEINKKLQAEHGSLYDNDVEQYTEILKILDHKPYYHLPDNTFPTVFTSSEVINREEATRMIEYLMRSLGFDDIMCKWKRLKHNRMIIPT